MSINVDENVQRQVREIFQHMEKTVTIKLFIDKEKCLTCHETKAILEIEKKYKLKEDFEISKILEAYKKSSTPFSENSLQEIINETGFDFRTVNGRLRQLFNNEKIFEPKRFQYVIEEFKKKM